ncbi:hypothetical protein DJ564_19100 [Pseudomonas sp. 31-12]|nr:hypothetical protein DJ564_19100 [Pseudomonas sp. 31-12]
MINLRLSATIQIPHAKKPTDRLRSVGFLLREALKQRPQLLLRIDLIQHPIHRHSAWEIIYWMASDLHCGPVRILKRKPK